MSEIEENRFKDFNKALKSKFNFALLAVAIMFLVEWRAGCPLMQKLLTWQYELRGANLNAENITFFSVFGSYKTIPGLANAYDRFLFWFFFAGAMAVYGWGLLVSALKR